jgi:hypothetical protein
MDWRERNRSREDREDRERGLLDRISDTIASWFGDEDAERRRRMDDMQGRMEERQGRQQHRGRGPRGYKRSDDRIKEDVNDRLSDHPYLDASDVEVEVDEAVVILTGNVDSRSDKRLAEDIAEGVSGVNNVENRLRVTGTQGTSTGVSGTMGTTGATGTAGAGTTGTSARAAGAGSSGGSSTGTTGTTTGTTDVGTAGRSRNR